MCNGNSKIHIKNIFILLQNACKSYYTRKRSRGLVEKTLLIISTQYSGTQFDKRARYDNFALVYSDKISDDDLDDVGGKWKWRFV